MSGHQSAKNISCGPVFQDSPLFKVTQDYLLEVPFAPQPLTWAPSFRLMSPWSWSPLSYDKSFHCKDICVRSLPLPVWFLCGSKSPSVFKNVHFHLTSSVLATLLHFCQVEHGTEHHSSAHHLSALRTKSSAESTNVNISSYLNDCTGRLPATS